MEMIALKEKGVHLLRKLVKSLVRNWLVGVLGFNGSLRQCFGLPDRGRKKKI